MKMSLGDEAAVSALSLPKSGADLCLLSLDGGGVRGLSTLYILRRVMTKVNAERKDLGLKSVKPCHIFDMIGGTSTGGLIAILLGRLEMDVDETMQLYEKLMSSVFEKKAHWMPVTIGGKVQYRFNQGALRDAMKDVLSARNIRHDELFEDGKIRECHTFVVATRSKSSTPVAIRAYPIKGEDNHDVATIIEAALATSAASSFFPPVLIGNREYTDGALGTNNPVEVVWKQAQDLWAPKDGELNPRIRAFISIGNGRPGYQAIEKSAMGFFKNTLVHLVTDTENSARAAAHNHRGLLRTGKYYRFNVNQGLEKVELEEYKKIDIIEEMTSIYLGDENNKVDVERCAEALSQKELSRGFPALSVLGQHLLGESLDGERKDCIRSLRCPNQKKAVQNIDPPHPGTLEWLNDTESEIELNDWIDRDRGLFWIRGIAGSGKTVTMKELCKRYHKTHGTEDVVIAYFFKNQGNDADNSLEGLLRMVLAKVLDQKPLIFNSLRDFYINMTNYGCEVDDSNGALDWDLTSLKMSFQLIAETLVEHVNICLFVDAVDECINTTIEDFVRFWQSYCLHDQLNGVKVCFTSRHNPENIQSSTYRVPGFDLERKTSNDIAMFILFNFVDLQLAIHQPDNLVSLLIILSTKAAGSWLYIKLAIEKIKKGSRAGDTMAEIIVALDDLPKDLFGFYETLSRDVDEKYINEMNRIFSLVLTAFRPLTLDEMRYIMSFGTSARVGSHDELKGKPYFVQDAASMKNRILSRGGGLLDVKTGSEVTTIYANLGEATVEFIHPTVKDFLSQETHASGSKIMHFQELRQQGHELLARALLSFFDCSDVKNVVQSLENTSGMRLELRLETEESMPLMKYAALWLLGHSEKAIELSCPCKEDVETFWASGSGSFDDWVLLNQWLLPSYHPSMRLITFASYAIVYGCRYLLKSKIEAGLDVNELIPIHGHYLALAASVDDVEIVKMLLDGKADIDAPEGIYGTALEAAASRGHRETVKVLLSQGASTNVVGGKYDDALCAATFSGKPEIVKLLLNAPSFPMQTFQEKWYKTNALMFAAMGVDNRRVSTDDISHNDAQDMSAIVRLLSTQGFDYSIYPVVSIPIIFWILGEGSVDCLRMLVKDPTYVNARSVDGLTLLLLICMNGTLEMLQLLDSKRADFHVECSRGGSPMHYAALNSSPLLLKHLLGKNLDYALVDVAGVTVLHTAFAYGSAEHVRLLLEAGADPKAVSTEGFTAIAFAVVNTHFPDVLSVLHDLPGMEINAKNRTGRTALHEAAQFGTLRAVQWLIDNGADIKSVDGDNRTALHFATLNQSLDNLKIIDLLIEEGLSVTSQDDGGSTPLHVAFQDPVSFSRYVFWRETIDAQVFVPSKTTRLAKYLLSLEGIDVNQQDIEGNTILHLASWRTLIDLMSLLAKAGSDMTVKNRGGWVPFDHLPYQSLRPLLEVLFSLQSEIGKMENRVEEVDEIAKENSV